MSPCVGLTGQLIAPVGRQHLVRDIPATSGKPNCFQDHFLASLTGNAIYCGLPAMCSAPQYPAISTVPEFPAILFCADFQRCFPCRLPATFPAPARLTKHRSRHCLDSQSAALPRHRSFQRIPRSTRRPVILPVTMELNITWSCGQTIRTQRSRNESLPASVRIIAIKACYRRFANLSQDYPNEFIPNSGYRRRRHRQGSNA